MGKQRNSLDWIIKSFQRSTTKAISTFLVGSVGILPSFYETVFAANHTIINATEDSIRAHTIGGLRNYIGDSRTIIVLGESSRGDNFNLEYYPKQKTLKIDCPSCPNLGANTQFDSPNFIEWLYNNRLSFYDSKKNGADLEISASNVDVDVLGGGKINLVNNSFRSSSNRRNLF